MTRSEWWRERALPILGFPGLLALAFVIEKSDFWQQSIQRHAARELSYWSEHVADHPDFALSEVRLALAYRSAHRWDAAGNAYARALELDPGYEPAVVGRWSMLRQADQPRQALEFVEGYLAAHPSCVICLYCVGVVRYQLQDLDAARAALEDFLSRGEYETSSLYGTSDAQLNAYLFLGRIAEAQGRGADARGFFERALARDPGNADALSALARLGSASRRAP